MLCATAAHAEPEKALLGKWWKMNGRECIEFLEDGSAVHEKGANAHILTWKVLGGKRLFLGVAGLGGEINTISKLSETELVLAGGKDMSGRYFRKKTDAVANIVTLEPGQSLARGAMKLTFLRVVNATKASDVERPGFIVCYRIDNTSDTVVLKDAEIRFGSVTDEFGNEIEGGFFGVRDHPPGIYRYELDGGEQEPGGASVRTHAVPRPGIAKSCRFQIKGCRVSTGDAGATAVFNVEFTREDADRGSREAREESARILATLERWISSRKTLVGAAITPAGKSSACEVRIESYEPPRRRYARVTDRTFTGTMHWKQRDDRFKPSKVQGTIREEREGWVVSIKESVEIPGKWPSSALYRLRLDEQGKQLSGESTDREKIALRPGAGWSREALKNPGDVLDRLKYKKAPLAAALKKKKFIGEAWDERGRRWPCRILFTPTEDDPEKVLGAMHWPTLNGTTLIKGRLEDTGRGWAAVFTEVKHHKRGNVALGTKYTVRLEGTAERPRLVGTWRGARTTGEIHVRLYAEKTDK